MTHLQTHTTKLSLCFRSSLSRFAQASAAALIALVLIGAARADTVKDFNVSGTAFNRSGGTLGSCPAFFPCSFSGTMMVDVTGNAFFTRGHVTAYDITFPGLPPFHSIVSNQGPFTGEWVANGRNNSDHLFLHFNTTPTSGSLLGFTGGTITGLDVLSSHHLTLFRHI